VNNEALIRLGVFSGVLVFMALWESFAPRRRRVVSRWGRSLNNLLLVVVASLIVRVIPALSAVAAARWASANYIGLLNLVEAPGWLKGLVALFALDLLIYGQHVATHRLPMLWRFHRVHHADLDLDATSGARFHPVEILLSMGIKVIAVTLLGAGYEAVLIFEVGLNAAATFNHSNVSLPNGCDRYLRWIIVTPDMHRVHHSIRPEETHSNFGFNIPWWDWLFRTYLAQPQDSHEHLTLGLPDRRTALETMPLAVMLWMPFRSVSTSNTDPDLLPSERATGNGSAPIS
jgi:sterol desaturase/sphingolipid hydroxylase (fatty acid hydroxylase superfamily)